MTPQTSVNNTVFLPDNPVLTEEAVIVKEEDSDINVSIALTGEDSMINVQSSEFGTVNIIIEDGENEYPYTIEVYEDEAGYSQIEVKER